MVFRAVIIGNPTPEVTWTRNNGEIDDKRYKITYDKSSGEHQLQVGSWIFTTINDKVNTLVRVCGHATVCQIPDVSSEEADTYKCFAKNEYGKAIVTAALNVIEGESQNCAQSSFLTLDVEF